MGNCLRGCVSKKKKRIVIESDGVDTTTGLRSSNGVDLDLSLVHKNIVAMGFPSQNFETCYRNPRDDVIEFLDENFGTNYRVYNLCSESDRQYDPVIFGGRVCSAVQWPDHLPPTLEMLRRLVLGDGAPYLAADARNVAVIHCKAGKGRTGVAVCCLLLAQGAAASHSEAIFNYGIARTKNGKGVTIPSQKRYIKYFDLSLKRDSLNNNAKAIETAGDVDDKRPEATEKHSRIRLASIDIKGLRYIHLLRRSPTTGKTTQILSLKGGLVGDSNADGDNDDDNNQTGSKWYHLPQVSSSKVEPTMENRNDDETDSSSNHRVVDAAEFTSAILEQDFCIAFSNSSEFPSDCMMLWLHADFCCSQDDSQSTFTAGEVDGWKMFFGKNSEEEIVRVKFIEV